VSKKPHTFMVDEELLGAFKDFVVRKHRQLRGGLSEEVNRALEEYLHHHRHEVNEEQQHHFSMQNLRADVRERAEKARRVILNDYADRRRIRGRELKRILRKATGLKDERPLSNYAEILTLHMGVLDCFPYSGLGKLRGEEYVIRG